MVLCHSTVNLSSVCVYIYSITASAGEFTSLESSPGVCACVCVCAHECFHFVVTVVELHTCTDVLLFFFFFTCYF